MERPPNPMQPILDHMGKEENALAAKLDGVWIPDSFALEGIETPDNWAFNIEGMVFRADLSYEVVAPEGFKNEQGHWTLQLPDSLFMHEKEKAIDIGSYRLKQIDKQRLILESSDESGFKLIMYLKRLEIE